MSRRWLAVPLAAIAWLLAGCDALTVRTFAGTIMKLSITANDVTAPGDHLEMWARDQNDNIVRLDAIYDAAHFRSAYGVQIRLTVDPNDPCMIVTDPHSAAYGEPLTSPRAYPKTVTVNGVPQTPEQQAQQVINRIKQVTSTNLGGLQ